MNISFISTYLPTQCGIATYTDYLASNLLKIDPQVNLKILAEKGAAPVKKGNLEIIPCWSRNEDFAAQLIKETKLSEIVHIQHEYGIYSFDDRLPKLLKGLSKSQKKVITLHCIRPAQFSPRGDIDEKYSKNLAVLADKTIVHLPSQKDILSKLGIPENKTDLIPHGTTLSKKDQKESRQKLNLPENGKIILMFGFIKKHKCIHLALDALKEISQQDDDFYFFLAGGLAPNSNTIDQEYTLYLDKKIKELNLTKKVIYPKKFFPNEDLPYLFGAGDLVLFPYYEEDLASSGSLHLALGANKPVIASNIPKFQELKQISKDLLVPPYNAAAIAKVALKIFKDNKYKQNLLKKIDCFSKKTSWLETAKRHLAVYNN